LMMSWSMVLDGADIEERILAMLGMTATARNSKSQVQYLEAFDAAVVDYFYGYAFVFT
jgi:hypothetical protein